MVVTCDALTLCGHRCKRPVHEEGTKCHQHNGCSNCSICMADIRTRGLRRLDCGHEFHKRCIDKWKSTGNHTCPVCRHPFDPPRFRASITIEPIIPLDPVQTIVNVLSGESGERIARHFDIHEGMGAEVRFTTENFGDMEDILTEFGLLPDDLRSISSTVEEAEALHGHQFP